MPISRRPTLPAILAACLALAGNALSSAAPPPPELAALQAKLASELTSTRRIAVEKIGRLAGAASPAAPALITALSSDPDDMVRTRAAWALGEIKQPVREIVAALLAATRDPNAGVRGNAFGSLRSLGAPALPHLEEARAHRDTAIRIAAVQTLLALGRAPDGADLAVLRDALGDQSPEVRRLAATCSASAGAGAEPLLPPLIALLDDPDTGVREATVSTLSRVDRQGASEAKLIHLLKADPSKGVKRLAASALGKIGGLGDKRIPALLGSLKDSDEQVRGNAVQSLAGFGPAAVAPLLEALGSANGLVRIPVLDTLQAIGPQAKPAIDPLLELLRSDPATSVRFRAAGALGLIGEASPRVLEALEKCAANDADPTVRAHAAGALRMLTAEPPKPSNS